MYNPNTLSKLADLKRQEIHRKQTLRRLAKKGEADAHYPTIVQHLVGLIHRQISPLRQIPPVSRLEQDMESQG